MTIQTLKRRLGLGLALALGLAACVEDTAEDRREERAERMEEAAGELAEGVAEARSAAAGENEIAEEVRGEIAELHAEEAMEAVLEPDHAVARLAPTAGNRASGVVRFDTTDDGVRVTVTLANLAPGSTHGIHIHEHGSCAAADASSAGGHYAPNDNDHALPPVEHRHAGDLGNVTADARGIVQHEQVFDLFSLHEDAPVLGRAVILHASADRGVQPSGGAGARIACGVIQPTT